MHASCIPIENYSMSTSEYMLMLECMSLCICVSAVCIQHIRLVIISVQSEATEGHVYVKKQEGRQSRDLKCYHRHYITH